MIIGPLGLGIGKGWTIGGCGSGGGGILADILS